MAIRTINISTVGADGPWTKVDILDGELPKTIALPSVQHWLDDGAGTGVMTFTPVGDAPASSGTAVSAQTLTAVSGLQSVATAMAFTGSGISYSLMSAPTGVTINATTGIVTIDTAKASVQSATSIVVRATNGGGVHDESFPLTIKTEVVDGANLVDTSAGVDGWTTQGSYTVASGTLSGTGAGTQYISLASPMTVGNSYRLAFSQKRIAGRMGVTARGDGKSVAYNAWTTGDYQFVFDADAAYDEIHFQSVGFDGSVGNVVVTDLGNSYEPANLLANGDFSDGASGWAGATSNGWNVIDGKLVAIAVIGSVTQAVTFNEFRTYRVRFTLSGHSSGSVALGLIGGAASATVSGGANGVHEAILSPGSGGNTTLRILPVGSFTGETDNVSVQEMGA